MPKLFLINKKAQMWGMDLIISAVIFSLAIAFFFLYTLNNSTETSVELDKLNYDAGVISDTLLSTGYPENWNETNVVEIGIISDGIINETKLERFYNMSRDNYTYVKRVLNTPYDYFFFLDENMTINTMEIEGFGKPGIGLNNISSENLVRVGRITIYKDKIMGATIYLWS